MSAPASPSSKTRRAGKKSKTKAKSRSSVVDPNFALVDEATLGPQKIAIKKYKSARTGLTVPRPPTSSHNLPLPSALAPPLFLPSRLHLFPSTSPSSL